MTSDVAQRTEDRLRNQRSRRLVAHAPLTQVLVTAAAAALAASGSTGPWLVLVSLVVAHRLSDRQHTVLGSLPVAVLTTVTTVVVVLHVLGESRAGVLASPGASRSVLVALSVVALPGLVRGRDQDRGRLARRREAVACVPAVVVLALGAWLRRQDLPHAVGALLSGWDNGAHVLMSAALTRTGDLSYGVEVYPRGLHALVALVLVTDGASGTTPQALEALLRAQSTTVWTVVALLAGTVALATLRCALRCRVPVPIATAAAVVASLVTLTPDFFNFTVLYGFETTIALAFVLAVVTLEVLSDRSSARTTVLLALALPATAHTYQLALPVVTAPLLITAWPLLRAGVTRHARALAVVALSFAASWLPAWSILVNRGVDVVGASGAVGPLPVLALSLGLAATVSLWLANRRRWAGSVLSMVLTLVAVATAGARLADASLTDYYPRKLLWHAALVTLPVTVTASAVALRTLAGRASGVSIVRLVAPSLAGAGAVVVAALAVPGPYSAASGAWGMPDAVITTLLHPDDENAVCALRSRYARQVGNRLLEFYEPVPVVPPLDDEGLPECPEPPTRP